MLNKNEYVGEQPEDTRCLVIRTSRLSLLGLFKQRKYKAQKSGKILDPANTR